MGVPKIFDELMAELYRCFEALPETRSGTNTQYEIKDAALSAFGVFFTQSASFLEYQRLLQQKKSRNNAQSLFHVGQIPSDPQIRNLLDPQSPELLYPVFTAGLKALQDSGQLAEYASYGGQVLISCDGTQTISSQNLACPECRQQELNSGKKLYSHSAILPVIVKAEVSRVLVLEPEFITPQDGSEKQDCERAAIKRWVMRNRERLGAGRYTLLGDDLYACQPICELYREAGFNFILVCKPDSHTALYEQVEYLAKTGLVEALHLRHWNGRQHELHDYRFVNQVPLRRGADAMLVNWCEITITEEEGGKRLYYNTFITNHELSRANIVPIVRDGRARWKSENETNNVLKTKGYHLEHNFGHGQQHLANFLLTLNLLAFQFHTLLEMLDEQYQLLRQHLGARRNFFNHLRTLLLFVLFEDWQHLMHFMLVGLELIPDT